MTTLEIQLDDHVLNQARKFAESHQYNLEELIVQILAQLGTPMPKDNILGLFSDEPNLLDQIVTSAMQSRETTPLRTNSE